MRRIQLALFLPGVLLHESMMDNRSLLEAADLNLTEFNREGARSTSGGLVHEEAGLLFFLPGHRFPVGPMGVMRTDSSVGAAEVLDRARAFFKPRNQGWAYWLMMHRDRDLAEALEKSGVWQFGDNPTWQPFLPALVTPQLPELWFSSPTASLGFTG